MRFTKASLRRNNQCLFVATAAPVVACAFLAGSFCIFWTPQFYMFQGNFTKMHSCRVCAAPLPKRRSNITLHLQSAHKLSFVKYCGGMGLGGLEETPEGERVNAAAERFDCPRCGEPIGGFRHLQEHFSSRHWRKGTDGRGAQFRAAAMMARRPLGLAKCVRCSRGPFPRDMLATHLKYWHGGGRGKRRHYRGSPRRAGEGADAVVAKTELAETELLPTIDCGRSLVSENEDCDHTWAPTKLQPRGQIFG